MKNYIYNPFEQVEKPCPVIFYIHGGMLMSDNPVMFKDEIVSTSFASQGWMFLIVLNPTKEITSSRSNFSLGK